MRTLPVVLSLTFHLFIAAALCGWSQLSPEVAGSEGLRGHPGAQLFIEMEQTAESKSERVKKAAHPVHSSLGEAIAVSQESEESVQSDQSPADFSENDSGSQELATQLPENVAGSGGQAGTSGEFASDPGNGDQSNELGLYLAGVHKRIQQKLRAPDVLSQTRRAEMRLRIQADGTVDEIEIRRSTGDTTLDRLAVDAVQRAQPFEPHPSSLVVNIPVVFRPHR